MNDTKTEGRGIELWAVLALTLTCAAISILPHAQTGFPMELWHLTPFFAVGLLFGRGLSLWTGVLAVIAGRLLANLGIAVIYGDTAAGFYGDGMWFDFAGLALLPLIGTFVRRRTPTSILAAAIAGPVAFFLISNFGVWYSASPKFAEPLLVTYEKGLPFLRNSLIATPLWAGLLFSNAVYGELTGATMNRRTLAA